MQSLADRTGPEVVHAFILLVSTDCASSIGTVNSESNNGHVINGKPPDQYRHATVVLASCAPQCRDDINGTAVHNLLKSQLVRARISCWVAPLVPPRNPGSIVDSQSCITPDAAVYIQLLVTVYMHVYTTAQAETGLAMPL